MPALDGMRVLDMTQYEAGTSCTQALAWLGADVVKVEQPGVGDPGRGVRTGTLNSPYFINWNSNKRSVTVNLREERGRSLLLELLPHYDVFVENYGPGVMERLGLTYEALKEAHPAIIYARLKGFGLSGPYADVKCFDPVAQNAAGAFSVTGNADGPPMKPGACVGDSGTGMQLAFAITAAYVQKLRTGEGQHIEISMQEAMTYYMRTRVAIGSKWGTQACDRTGASGGLPPVDLYPCKPFGPNDYAYVMPITDGHWDTLCAAMGRPDLLVDERFTDLQKRQAHGKELYELIASWTRQLTKQEVMETLGAAGVPCSACLDTGELHTDRHLVERDFVHHIDHPMHGEVPLLGFGPRLSGSDVPIERAPLLGEHTGDVLGGDLGLDPAELDKLHHAGVIRWDGTG